MKGQGSWGLGERGCTIIIRCSLNQFLPSSRKESKNCSEWVQLRENRKRSEGVSSTLSPRKRLSHGSEAYTVPH